MTAGDQNAVLKASMDPALHARIVSRRPLFLTAGADPHEDRLGFVRAASGLCWYRENLAIIQDDTAFLALCAFNERGPVEPLDVRSVALPRGPGGRRRFEKELGNKLDKYDFESCFAVEGPAGARLFAFGSGPMAQRRHVAVLENELAAARLVRADALYENLRVACAIPNEVLNIEGAFVCDADACFLQRGNAAHSSAVLRVRLDELVRWLDNDAKGPAPLVRGILRHDLGCVDGVTFGFTDGFALADGRMVFLAAAEDTDNPIDDGAVLGMRLGVVRGGAARMCDLRDEHGRSATIKAEGIAVDRREPGRLWLVTDADNATEPAELIEVAWRGFDELADGA